MGELKVCSTCKTEKELPDFDVDRRKTDGRQSRCKICKSVLRDRRKAIRDNQNWRKLNPESLMIQRAQQRAKKQGCLCILSKKDIVIPEICPILGIPLKGSLGNASKNSPSLDRIIPALGYTRGNVQIISYQANTMKNNATPEEILAFGKWAVKNYESPLLSASRD